MGNGVYKIAGYKGWMFDVIGFPLVVFSFFYFLASPYAIWFILLYPLFLVLLWEKRIEKNKQRLEEVKIENPYDVAHIGFNNIGLPFFLLFLLPCILLGSVALFHETTELGDISYRILQNCSSIMRIIGRTGICDFAGLGLYCADPYKESLVFVLTFMGFVLTITPIIHYRYIRDLWLLWPKGLFGENEMFIRWALHWLMAALSVYFFYDYWAHFLSFPAEMRSDSGYSQSLFNLLKISVMEPFMFVAVAASAAGCSKLMSMEGKHERR